MNDEGSVSIWLDRVKKGSRDKPLNRLWERYFEKMVSRARDHLRARGRAPADAEDVALAAFESFVQRAQAGLFPKLNDRGDLWAVLGMLTGQKAVNQMERDMAAKRGGKIVHTPAAAGGDDLSVNLDLLARDPDPKEAVLMAEGLEEMLNLLGKSDLKQVAVWRMEGHTNEDIASKLDCSLAAVERKFKAIRAIYREAGVWVE